jgi:protein-S-isoprenylcysteine O-methyltransferase Ste14
MLPWAMRTLGQMGAPGVGVFEDHELITSGPYRFLRHPGYSATLALWLGAALGTLNWLLLVLWPLMVALLFMVGIRPEEALLHERFKADYEEYVRQTSRLIPRVWKRQHQSRKHYEMS